MRLLIGMLHAVAGWINLVRSYTINCMLGIVAAELLCIHALSCRSAGHLDYVEHVRPAWPTPMLSRSFDAHWFTC